MTTGAAHLLRFSFLCTFPERMHVADRDGDVFCGGVHRDGGGYLSGCLFVLFLASKESIVFFVLSIII